MKVNGPRIDTSAWCRGDASEWQQGGTFPWTQRRSRQTRSSDQKHHSHLTQIYIILECPWKPVQIAFFALIEQPNVNLMIIKKGKRPQGGIQHFNSAFYLLVLVDIKICVDRGRRRWPSHRTCVFRERESVSGHSEPLWTLGKWRRDDVGDGVTLMTGERMKRRIVFTSLCVQGCKGQKKAVRLAQVK